MASAMDAAVQSASKALDTSGIGANTVQGLQAGMDLAQRQQAIEQKRQEMQFQQEQHMIAKADWMHEQQKNIALASTKEEGHALIDQYEREVPQVTGQRLDPSQVKYLRSVAGKVTPYSQAMIAAATMNDMVKNPSLYIGQNADAQHRTALAYAQASLDHIGMNARDAIKNAQPVTQQANQLAIALQSAAAKEKIVTPEVAKTAGMSQEDAQAQANQSNIGMARNNRMLDDQAVKAGQSFENDKIITANKVSQNSLQKSSSILENEEKPLTSTDLNLAYNDYINSVAAGGVATEGKIQRELPETWEAEFNRFKAKSGKFDDMRKDEVGAKLVDMLKKNIAQVKSDMDSQSAEQAKRIYGNYAEHGNPKVRAIANQKLKLYNPKEYSKLGLDKKEEETAQVSQPGTANALAGESTATPASSDAKSQEVARARMAGQQAIEMIKRAGGVFKGKTEEDVRRSFKDNFKEDL